jgi:hypothetical protein
MDVDVDTPFDILRNFGSNLMVLAYSKLPIDLDVDSKFTRMEEEE